MGSDNIRVDPTKACDQVESEIHNSMRNTMKGKINPFFNQDANKKYLDYKDCVILKVNNLTSLYEHNTSARKRKQSKLRSSAKETDVIVHNIFSEMNEICSDKYWKSILYNASKGKFKRGVQFKNSVLCSKSKNKVVSVHLDSENPSKSLDDFILFMNENFGDFSPEDKKKKNLELKTQIEELSTLEITSWSKVKREMNKIKLINEYIERFNKELIKDGEDPLSLDQINDMKSKILLGINTGSFNNDNIIIKSNSIFNIEGLLRTNNGFFSIDPSLVKVKKQKTKKEDEDDVGTLISCTTKTGLVHGNTKNANTNLIKTWIKIVKGINKRTLKYTNNKIYGTCTELSY